MSTVFVFVVTDDANLSRPYTMVPPYYEALHPILPSNRWLLDNNLHSTSKI